MFGQLTAEQIETLLKKQDLGRIGCHANGVTYVVPTSYAYENNCIYAHTGEGMKLQMMRQNPAVCFEVEDTRDEDNWKSVIAWGNFEEINDPGARAEALKILNHREYPLRSSQTVHLGDNWPFNEDNLGEVIGVVFCIRLQEKTGRFEESGSTPVFSY